MQKPGNEAAAANAPCTQRTANLCRRRDTRRKKAASEFGACSI
jgi:hypothetical protein